MKRDEYTWRRVNAGEYVGTWNETGEEIGRVRLKGLVVMEYRCQFAKISNKQARPLGKVFTTLAEATRCVENVHGEGVAWGNGRTVLVTPSLQGRGVR